MTRVKSNPLDDSEGDLQDSPDEDEDPPPLGKEKVEQEELEEAFEDDALLRLCCEIEDLVVVVAA